MKITHPRYTSDISAAWLTQGLKAQGFLRKSLIIGFEMTRIGEDFGVLSCVVRITLQYDFKEQGAPDSVVVKLVSDSEVNSSIADELHAFEREIQFYQGVAKNIPSSGLPQLYFAVTEAPSYAIVMEDLSDYIAGDQIVGMHNEQVIATSQVLAEVQAQYWNNSALESLSWMPENNGVISEYAQHWPSFVQHYGDLIGTDAIQVGEQTAANIQWLLTEINNAPRTIVHSDLRADNLLFGANSTQNTVRIIDWQLAIRSMGAFDIARLLGGSEPPGERRGHQFEILRAWHDVLLECGVEEYSWDDAVFHFRIGALCCLAFPIKFHEEVASIGGRIEALTKVMAQRMFIDAIEIDALSVLP